MKIKTVNGLELVEYIHAATWPAIRIQYRINSEETNVIGWVTYGPKTKSRLTRKEAIEKACEKATVEEYEHQKSIFNQ